MEITPGIDIQNIEIYRALNKFSQDPENIGANVELAKHYYKIKEYGSAISFLNRINEFAGESDETYESLILIGECCVHLGERTHQIKTTLAQAIALDPDRPEAYYGLYKLYEKDNEHRQAYAWISTGIKKLHNKKNVTGSDRDWVKGYSLS